MYALTERGREALRAYLRSPSPFPRLQQDVTHRLLAGDLIEDDEIVASVAGMRPEIDRIARLVDEMAAQAVDVPHRARYLRLQHALARRLLAAYGAWIDEVEAELDGAARAQRPTGPAALP